jgi:hypothetical protein
VSDDFFKVGHTHNRTDQRFSVIGSKLKKCQTLQTPYDFLSLIKKELPTEAGREVITEELHGAYDFQSYFDTGESFQAVGGMFPFFVG